MTATMRKSGAAAKRTPKTRVLAGGKGKKAAKATKARQEKDPPKLDDQTILLDPDDVLIPEKGHFLYDPDEGGSISEATVTSMLRIGVVQNIVVWKDGKKWYVVAGRDRVRHAREAKRIQAEQGSSVTIRLKATVRRGSPVYLLSIMATENAHRRKGGDPVKQAEIMQRMIDNGCPEEELSVWFKMGQKSIKRRLGLLSLTEKGKAAVRKGIVPASKAEKLVSKEREEQDAIIDRALEQAGKGEKPELAEISDIAPGRRVVAAMAEDELMDQEVRAAMLWCIGHLDAKKAGEAIEGFASAYDRVNGGHETERRKIEERMSGVPRQPSGKALGALVQAASRDD